jgi:hypothetical protein
MRLVSEDTDTKRTQLLTRIDRISYNGVSTIMLACKSDPDAVLAIEAPEGNALGEPYNVGLIEVTQVTAEGKSKIRNGLRWLIYKLEQKDRESTTEIEIAVY